MKRFLLVTGTDTGVGKTTVSVALLAAWRRRGHLVRPQKPIETGLDDRSTESDAFRLAQAVGIDGHATSWLRFRRPVAPDAAARAEGQVIDPDRLIAHCRQLPGDHILIEGAGGLLVPIAKGFVVADLAQSLGARLLVVARTRLGTINHTLLTLHEAQRRGLCVAGLVLNRTVDEIGPEETDNVRLLREHADGGTPDPIGPLPFSESQAPDVLAALAEAHLPVGDLFLRAFAE